MKSLYESLLDDFDTIADNINVLSELVNPKASSEDQDDLLRSLKPVVIEDGQKPLKNLNELLNAKPDQLFLCFPSYVGSGYWAQNPTIIRRIGNNSTRFFVYYSFGDGRIKRRWVDLYMLRGEKIPKRKRDIPQRDANDFITQINPPKCGEVYEFPKFLYDAWKKAKIESIVEEF